MGKLMDDSARKEKKDKKPQGQTFTFGQPIKKSKNMARNFLGKNEKKRKEKK